MACLQQVLSQPPSSLRSGRCDCRQLREFAFRSHAVCYTQAQSSICRLPASDWNLVYANIDGAGLFGGGGISQLLSVAFTCVGQSGLKLPSIDRRGVN